MDYGDFYMGTWGGDGRTGLAPAYRLILSRLKTLG
jgi:hypothetical protein